MPAMIAQPGIPLWQTLVTPDLEGAKRFYAAVFGWEYRDTGEGADEKHVTALKQGMPVADIMENPQLAGSEWRLYLYNPDLEQAHDAALAVGGESIIAPARAGDGSTRAMMKDPTGSLISLMRRPDEQAIIAAGEPGTPTWYELSVVHNWEETLTFYHELTGLDIKVHGGTEGNRYATGDVEGHAVMGFWERTAALADAGVSDEEIAGTIGAWVLGWGVADLNQARREVELNSGAVHDLGASTGEEAASLVSDPHGAMFQLMEVPEYEPEADDVHEPDLFA